MPAWFLTRLPWRQANVKFKTDFLTKLDLGHSKVPFQRGMPKIECLHDAGKNITLVMQIKGNARYCR